MGHYVVLQNFRHGLVIVRMIDCSELGHGFSHPYHVNPTSLAEVSRRVVWDKQTVYVRYVTEQLRKKPCKRFLFSEWKSDLLFVECFTAG